MDILRNYFLLSFHPIKFLIWSRDQKLWNIDPYKEGAQLHWKMLEIWEAIGIAWIFVILKGLFDLILWSLGLVGISMLLLPESMLIYAEKGVSVLSVVMILTVLFFPFLAIIKIYILKAIISFWADLFRLSHWNPNITNDILVTPFCSYWVYPLPLVGGVLQKIFSFIYLIMGLSKSGGFNKGQIVIILLTPIILFILLLCFIIFFVLLMKLNF